MLLGLLRPVHALLRSCQDALQQSEPQLLLWMGAWYFCSLMTLFLNKIILSSPGGDKYVLGITQMITTAVLGAAKVYGPRLLWPAQRGPKLRHASDSQPPPGLSQVLDPASSSPAAAATGEAVVSAAVGPSGARAEALVNRTPAEAGGGWTGSNIAPPLPQQSDAPPLQPEQHAWFYRDMVIVGVMRGLTVLLGLVSLAHVAVSFTETIKSSAPFFTVVFARLMLGQHTSWQVNLSLLPVMLGLMLCSATELSFDTIGFLAAIGNNIIDCVQNVFSKQLLNKMTPVQLQFYTSAAAAILQLPVLLYSLWPQLRGGQPMTTQLVMLILVDAVFYHLQSVTAYCTMNLLNPVSQSVANTVKRALLIFLSILWFGNPITAWSGTGMVIVFVGVFLYNHCRIHYPPRLRHRTVDSFLPLVNARKGNGLAGAPSAGHPGVHNSVMMRTPYGGEKSGSGTGRGGPVFNGLHHHEAESHFSATNGR